MNFDQVNKIIELELKNVDKFSNYNIEILYSKLKRLEFQKQNLLNEKIYWFEKRKKKDYIFRIENINREMEICIQKIEEEIQSINGNS